MIHLEEFGAVLDAATELLTPTQRRRFYRKLHAKFAALEVARIRGDLDG